MTTSLSEKPTYSDDEPRVSHGEGQDDGVGNLTFDQYTTGGLGRHLGIVSTTFLMYESPHAEKEASKGRGGGGGGRGVN